jgi:CheY-like chemotaxis protein
VRFRHFLPFPSAKVPKSFPQGQRKLLCLRINALEVKLHWYPYGEVRFLVPKVDSGVHPMLSRRLLCVDDDREFRQFYKNLLGSYGFDVTLAASGKQALKLFLSRHVDAVVTDLEMPGMTGLELASRLKKLRPELPVLLVSGTKSLKENPKEVDASLAKGTPTPKLLDQIEDLLKKAQSRPQSLSPRRFAPLGSVLASIALAAYALPKIIK